ncbi:MAG: hypothetical protein LBT95_04555 [Treponema sp.]|jgi:hypothetical protein|nr:hypothetical protein [Treponema sp.]
MRKCLWWILFCFAGMPVFGIDLTEYPGAINKGAILFNIGAGYGTSINTGTKTRVPPVIASADYALSIGGLPFSLGLILGFSGEYTKDPGIPLPESPDKTGSSDFSYYVFGAGGRFSYHFNWGVNKLDTYATITAGFLLNSWNYTIEALDGGNTTGSYSEFLPLWGVNIGGRYFFVPHFGLFLDLGYTRLTVISLGMAFKF